jgi:DNA polymerase IV
VWTEPILHVDMDSFFVEVERLGDPSLLGVPVAVGGSPPRGVIASASYEARSFGVRSAQPTAMAFKACPGLRLIAPSHGRYEEMSARVFAVFRSFTPRVEGLSLDEAFLDVSGLRRHFDSPVEVGQAVRRAIREEVGLPASVGVASNKLVAKLASEAAKPDGMCHVTVAGQLAFLHALPARALPGVGPATMAGLERLGVATVGDIAELPESTLARSVGANASRHLGALAAGEDSRPVEPDVEAKSVSVEETYRTDLEGLEMMEAALLSHAQRLSGRLRRAGLAGRTITLKVRYPGFETVTRSRTGEGALQGARELFQAGAAMLADLAPDQPVRLLGLGVSTLVPDSERGQMGLGWSAEWEEVERAVARVRGRYGDSSVRPARLIHEDPRSSGFDVSQPGVEFRIGQ